MGENTSPQPEAQAIEPQHVVDVIRYCLREYAVDHDMTTEEMATITIEDLVTWCLLHEIPEVRKEEICGEVAYDGSGSQPAGSHISELAVDAVWQQFQNAYAACKLLFPIWPWITSNRPPLEVGVAKMEVSVSFLFRDDTAMAISMPSELQEKPLHGGFLAALLYSKAMEAVNTIVKDGLDELRREYALPIQCSAPPEQGQAG
jgi:hypothetical protein